MINRLNNLTRSRLVAKEFVLSSRMIFCKVSKIKEYFRLEDETESDVEVQTASSGDTRVTPRRGSKEQFAVFVGFG